MKRLYPSHSGQSKLADAKTRFDVHALWRHFKFEGEPSKSCRCPFHDDKNASFSVKPDGSLWNCFAECGGGDAVDFLQRASGLSRKEACRKFIELAGGHVLNIPRATRPFPKPADPKPKPTFPEFRKGTRADFDHLAGLRKIGREGLELASQRGLLWFATLRDCPAWVISDSERVNAQARRMDGQPWTHIGGKKAWTLPGAYASWPIGIREAQPFPAIALNEGGPDFLAAHHFIHCEGREADCAAVTLIGASLGIHEDALPMFAGKRVRIFGHDDSCKDRDAGREAVERWCAQLTRAGAEVDAFKFNGLRKVDGSPVIDLNDVCLVDADDFEANRELWSLLP